MEADIVTLSRESMEHHLREIMEIDRGLLGEVWERSHFLLDLPGKWEISHIALDKGGAVLGFIIGSIKPQGAHIHREAIAERCRRQGLAMRLMGAAGVAVRRLSIQHITAKVHKDHSISQRMLRRLGWEETGREGADYLLAVDVDTLIARASEK
jgi:ribosomal protein S18 acetylase RimI-like enzyme